MPREPGTQNEQRLEADAGAIGVIDEARRVWQDLSGLAHDRLQLAVLETRLAGNSLVTMIAAGVIVAVLLVSAWLGLLAAIIVLLVGTGLAIGFALAAGVVANLVLAAVLVKVIRSKSEDLRWAATLRGLQDSGETTPPRPLQSQSR